MKYCSSCKKYKEVNEFYNCKSYPDGKNKSCIICSKIFSKIYRESPRGKETQKRRHSTLKYKEWSKAHGIKYREKLRKLKGLDPKPIQIDMQGKITAKEAAQKAHISTHCILRRLFKGKFSGIYSIIYTNDGQRKGWIIDSQSFENWLKEQEKLKEWKKHFKHCSACKNDLPIDDFYIGITGIISSWCKRCSNQNSIKYMKNWINKHREEVNKKRLEYSRRPEIKERRSEYRNRLEVKAKRKKWFKEHYKPHPRIPTYESRKPEYHRAIARKSEQNSRKNLSDRFVRRRLKIWGIDQSNEKLILLAREQISLWKLIHIAKRRMKNGTDRTGDRRIEEINQLNGQGETDGRTTSCENRDL
jgi:hypothetical protein